MKKISFLFLFAAFLSLRSFAEATDTSEASSDTSSLKLQFLSYDTTGSINLGTGLATLNIPAGFKYLNSEQSGYVLHDLWGNPPSETLGMIFPDDAGELIPATWAIKISYEEEGHVKDDDAKDIDYEELLTQMQKEIEEANPQRKEAGYQGLSLLGWASPPYYDNQEKKLHWAKRILFEGDSSETLNYNIRILGRKGVLVLNAIGEMEQLNEIKSRINPILANVNFNEGNRYADFDESTDKVAAYGIGGLIAGGVLLKTGLLGKIGILLLKFIKPVLVGLAVLGGAIWKFFSGKKDQQA